jgi:hypothetical protein
MKIVTHISITLFLAQVIFLLLPTSLVAFFILWNSHHYFTLLQDAWLTQTLYFSGGMLIAFLLAQCRLRFLPLFAALLMAFFSTYNLLDNYAIGEFDSWLALWLGIAALLVFSDSPQRLATDTMYCINR